MRDDTVQALATAVQSLNQTTMDRLRAKYLPSPLEISEIESFIRDAEITLATFDEGVQGLEQLREDAARAIVNAQALSVSVRKLAPETLQQIFSYCINSYCVQEHVLDRKLPYPTICLTSVCLFWRELIWAQPAFWNKIFISFPMLLRNPKHADLVQHYLVQSGTLLLDIAVVHESEVVSHGNEWYSSGNASLVREMFFTLVKNCLRWGRYTSFFGSCQELESYFGPSVHFPNLRYLHWTISLPPSRLLYSSQLQLFRGRSLGFTSRHSHHLFLTMIELVVTGITSCYTIQNFLRRMPFLKKLVMTRFTEHSSGSDTDTSLYVSKILTMSISLDVLSVEGWELLHLPHLRTLELVGPARSLELLEPYHPYLRRFSEILHNTGSILHTVKLDSIPNKEVVAFFALHPFISDLTLRMPYIDPTFVLDALDISRKDTNIVLPNLRSLSIATNDDIYCQADSKSKIKQAICSSVHQMVESRTTASIYECKGAVRLETLALETQLWRDNVGRALFNYNCLSDRLTMIDKVSMDFYVEVS